MHPTIFISHISEDSHLARVIQETIDEAYVGGIEVFVSSNPDSIQLGEIWFDKIESNLKKASLILVLCSDLSVTRPWINFEAGAGWARQWTGDLPVIPICYGGLRKGRLPQPLSRLQGMDLHNPQDFLELIRRISAHLHLKVPKIDWESVLAKMQQAHIRPANDSRKDTALVPLKKRTLDHAETLRTLLLDEMRDPTVLHQGLVAAIDSMLQLRQHLKYWGVEADAWINDFHACIQDYSTLYATDVQQRSPIGSPRFELYLRSQYAAKLRMTPHQDSGGLRPLLFTSRVFEAVQRTGWQADNILWEAPRRAQRGEVPGIEIVRILVRPLTILNKWEIDMLEVLDRDHAAYGIPLFVIDQNRLDSNQVIDFAIGLGRDGQVKKCYEYLCDRGEVISRDHLRGKLLEELFVKMLSDPTLRTVGDYLGYVMVRDPERSAQLAADYHSVRKPSNQLVEFLRQHIKSDAMQAGLDVGCGTGNYTFPFLGDFKKVTGVDINEDMLATARRNAPPGRADQVEFARSDAVSLCLEDESFDAVWSISTMHYLTREKQIQFLRECYRVLRPGGRLVIDVGEFAEQHPSLWVMEYFPSLRSRYTGKLFRVADYRRWLQDAGFHSYSCVPIAYAIGESDFFIRSGQENPGLYLKDSFVKANPAFRNMSHEELKTGRSRLEDDMESGQIEEVMQRCKALASVPGDLGFLVAQR